VNSQRAWIVTAAVGWALAIFAGGVLLGMEIGDDDVSPASRSSQVAGGATALEREAARADDPARGEPLRVSLRDVRGELAIGPAGSGGAREAGGSRPARDGTGGAVLARRGAGAGRGAAPGGAQAAPRPVGRSPRSGRPVRRRAGRRFGQRRRGRRRRAHRRSPAPPVVPVAPFVPAPPDDDDEDDDDHRGHGHGHDDDGHHGRGHDDDDHDDDDD
jgi:hypothetical protein